MNAHTNIDAPARLPVTDDMMPAVFGDTEIHGEMLVDYVEERFERDGETYIKSVDSAEIIGFHLGGNVMLTRDQLVAIDTESGVAHLETVYAEERAGLIG